MHRRRAGEDDEAPAGMAGLRALDHVARGGAQREERAVEIDRHDAAPLLRRQLVQLRALLADGGVGEARIDAARFRERLAEARLDLAFVGTVPALSQRPAARPRVLVAGARELLGIRAPNDEIGPGLGEPLLDAE